MDDESARLRMVESQIVRRGVRDQRVLAAMREVPRHLFVPDALRGDAYSDHPLHIGQGQTISQPYIVAAMTEALAPKASDYVLEVGTGSGYQTAVLARLSRQVVSIERHAALAESARAVLDALHVANIEVVIGDGTEGAPDHAPFDRILVTAGAPSVPETLREQLAEGGRLVIPVGASGFQHLTIVDRLHGEFRTREGEACVFVPLVGRHGWPEHSR